MISGGTKPIGHVSPLKRIDPAHPGRKSVITALEWFQSGTMRAPDAAIYDYHPCMDAWILKDGI